MIKLKDKSSKTKNELLYRLNKLHFDDDTVLAVLSYMNTEKLRKQMIDYIDKEKNISGQEITVVALYFVNDLPLN